MLIPKYLQGTAYCPLDLPWHQSSYRSFDPISSVDGSFMLAKRHHILKQRIRTFDNIDSNIIIIHSWFFMSRRGMVVLWKYCNVTTNIYTNSTHAQWSMRITVMDPNLDSEEWQT